MKPLKHPFGAFRWASRANRFTLGFVIVAGSLLYMPRAEAAHWELTYTVDGENSYAPNGGPITTEDWTDDYPGDATTGEFPNTQGRYGPEGLLFYYYPSSLYKDSGGDYPALTSKIDGEVTVILKWTQDPDDATLPPAPQWAAITVNGYSYADYNGQDSNTHVIATMGNNEDPGADTGVTVSVDHENLGADNDPYTPDVWADSKHVSGTYKRIQAVPTGATQVTFKFRLQAQVESHAGNTQKANGQGLIGEHALGAEVTALPLTYILGINSDIEPSYHKETDASRLPRIKSSVSGNWVVDVAKLRDGIYSTTGPWDVQSDPNNGEPVDSVATWIPPANQPSPGGPPIQIPGTGAWFGGDSSAPNIAEFHLGYTDPVSHIWSLSGGTAKGYAATELANTTSSNDVLDLHSGFNGVDASNAPTTDLRGISLGGDKFGVGVTASSTIGLNIVDASNLTGAASYGINWHLPIANPVPQPDGPIMKDAFENAGIMPMTSGMMAHTCPAKDFDYNSAIDDVLVLTKAVGLPTEAVETLWNVFKAATSLTDLAELSDHAEEVVVDGTLNHNGPEQWENTVRYRPENIVGLSATARQNLIDNGTSWGGYATMDCYLYRVRYHYLKTVKADLYDIHGLSEPDATLTTDVTKRNGDGSPKIQFENFYVPSGATPSFGDQVIP